MTARPRGVVFLNEGGAAVHETRELGTVLLGLAGDGTDIRLIRLAQVGRVGAGNSAVLAHPGDGDGGIETAGERDTDALSHGKTGENFGHDDKRMGCHTDCMARIIFPNLAVSDLERSKAFYSGLGFPVNPQFTDENASAIVVSDDIILMLLSPGFAEQSGLAQPTGIPPISLALSADSRDEVDALMEAAVMGGAETRGEAQDLGFMYSRGVTDPDGHYLDFVWMDPGNVEAY